MCSRVNVSGSGQRGAARRGDPGGQVGVRERGGWGSRGGVGGGGPASVSRGTRRAAILLQTQTERSGRRGSASARQSTPPPLPPLPPPSRPRRAPPARHRQHRARVANARGDREPRAPGKLCEHRSRPAPDASGGRPGAFAGSSRGRGARGPSSQCPALARPPSGAPARPPSSLPLRSGSGSGGCVCVGGKALLPLCSSGGRGDGGRPRARPAHLAPLPEGHAVLPARAFPHPTVFGP